MAPLIIVPSETSADTILLAGLGLAAIILFVIICGSGKKKPDPADQAAQQDEDTAPSSGGNGAPKSANADLASQPVEQESIQSSAEPTKSTALSPPISVYPPSASATGTQQPSVSERASKNPSYALQSMYLSEPKSSSGKPKPKDP